MSMEFRDIVPLEYQSDALRDIASLEEALTSCVESELREKGGEYTLDDLDKLSIAIGVVTSLFAQRDAFACSMWLYGKLMYLFQRYLSPTHVVRKEFAQRLKYIEHFMCSPGYVKMCVMDNKGNWQDVENEGE